MPLIIYDKVAPWRIATEKYDPSKGPKKGGSAGTLLIRGGTNDLTASEWDLVKDHPDVKRAIQHGILKIVGARSIEEGSPAKAAKVAEAKGSPAKLSEVKDLSKHKPKDAVLLVQNTTDVETLRRWLAFEKKAKQPRPTVGKAINDQVKHILDVEKKIKDAAEANKNKD